ncbi:MAG: hypothetical protein ACREHF_00595 [Rhizomicrobium sp.]
MENLADEPHSIEARAGADASEDTISADLTERIPLLFQSEFEAHDARVRQRFADLLGIHQERADALIANVRRTAADVPEIGYAAPSAEEVFELKRIPYWVTKAREAMRPLPAGAFEVFLPAAIRKRRLRARLIVRLGDVLRRNVENLRWSMRQTELRVLIAADKSLSEIAVALAAP